MRTPRTLLTVEQAAKHLAIEVQTLRTWTRRGSVQSYKMGSLVRYRLDDLERFIDECATQPSEAPNFLRPFQFAELMGVSRPYISKLIKQEKIPVRYDGKIDVHKASAAMGRPR